MFDIFKSKQERLQAKVEKFVSLQNEFSGVNTRIDELAIEFATRDSEFKKALEQEKDEFIRGRIESKYQEFTKSHLKNIGTVKREKESLMKAMEKVYSDDPEFQEILAEEKLHKSYTTILSNYRSNKIDLNTCDTLLKAVQHKYIRKTPDGKGGWDYVYEEEKEKELKQEEIKQPNVRKIAQNQLVLSVKRKPLIGEKIKFIRFGDIVEKSKNWVSGELENGMSVYSLNKDGAAEQSIRSEFLNRKAIIGEGVVVGYGSDEEPIIQNIQNTKRATKKDVDKAEFYGLGKSKWLEYLDKMERNMIEIDGELHPVSNSTLKKSEAAFPFMQPYLETIGEAFKNKKETGKVKYSDNIVFNSEGKLLLLKRSENDKTFAGMYVIPGGHVDLGEDCETAAKRELYEEAGIEVEEVQFAGEYEDKKVHIKYYQSHTDKDPVLQQEEIWGYEWVELKDLDNYPMPFNMCENIKKVLNPYNFKQQVVKVKKALEDDLINPSQYKALMRNVLEKAKKAHSGEIRTWGKDRMQKQPDGSWKKLFDSKGKKEGGNEFQKIKDYAERIIKGEKQIERLSSEEEQGRIAGGRANVEATLLIGADAGASDENKEPFERRPIQEELIEDYAKKNNLWIERMPEFNSNNFIDSGAEAKVYRYGNNKVVKINNLSQHEEPIEFLDRIALHNHLFPDTKYEVVGFGRFDGDFSVIVKQPFIEDNSKVKVSKDEIRKEMEAMGFEHNGGNNYISDDYLIEDLHAGNVLNTKYGLSFIDPIIYLNKKVDGYGGKRELGSIDLNKSQDQDISKEHLKEMINEHKRLVKVLENDTSEDNQAEYRLQKKELKEYLEKYTTMKSSHSDIEKGRKVNIGEIREWSGKKMKKVAPSKWEEVKESNHKKEDELKTLESKKQELLKEVEVLVKTKKKLYSNVDIESPKSNDEKKLEKEISDLFSQINSIVVKKREIIKQQNINKSEEDDLQKAWTKHPVGAVVTRKDGTRWKKISETGNSKADWKQITKDKGSKPEDAKEAKNSTKEEGQTQNPTNLTEAAKNASETALNAAIKGSGDEKMRQAAHEELNRREKEERVQEEPEKKEEEKDAVMGVKESEPIDKINKLEEDLTSNYKDLTQELINFTDYDNTEKLKELQIKQKDISRFIQNIKNLSNKNIEEESNKLRESINFEGEIKDLIGDGEILSLEAKTNKKGTKVVALFEDGYTERFFDKDKEFVEMEFFYLNPLLEKGKGKGTEIFKNQVNQFKKLGFKSLKTLAGNIAGMNGYYTWARLGYELSDEFEKNALLDMIDFEDDVDLKGNRTLQDIMSSNKGRKWWKEYGFAFNGVFDLRDDSISMKTLKNYKHEQ